MASVTEAGHEIALSINWVALAIVTAAEWVAEVLAVAAGIGLYQWVRDHIFEIRRGD